MGPPERPSCHVLITGNLPCEPRDFAACLPQLICFTLFFFYSQKTESKDAQSGQIVTVQYTDTEEK